MDRAAGHDPFRRTALGSNPRRARLAAGLVHRNAIQEEGPRRRFLVRPSDYREAEKRASDAGGELLGFYHSHPDHPARPSQYDLDHAWPFFSYVIVSVREGVSEDMTSWRLREDRSAFDPEELTHA